MICFLRHIRADWLIVLIVALIPRILAYFTLPLIITNDGVGYLEWGELIASGRWPDIPVQRVPGYPIFLGTTFALFGETTHAVMLTQSVLGICSSLLAWRIAKRMSGRTAGLIAGSAIALEPWLFTFEHYALSESLTLFLVLGACAASLGYGKSNRLTLGAILAGLCISIATLTRPAMLAWVPFIGLACLAGAPSPKRAVAPAVAFAVGVMVTFVPWLVYNKNRDVQGIVQTDGLALWGGLARAKLLEHNFQLPGEISPHAADLFQDHPPSEDEILNFYTLIGKFKGIDREKLLSDWVRESIKRNPAGYLKAVLHAAAWQSNAMLPASPYTHDELRWLMRRLGRDGTLEGQVSPNFQVSLDKILPERYQDHAPFGPQAYIYRKWPIGMSRNFVHPLLGLASLTSLILLIKRRRYAPAAIILGSFALVAGHALLLQPFSRYSTSAWALWWCGFAILIAPRKCDDEPTPSTA